MAANIARAKFPIHGWNRTPERPGVKVAEEAGVRLAATAADAVTDAEFVFLCLSDVPDLVEMLFGANGIAPLLKPDTIVVDMSTTGPRCARDVYERLSKQGVSFLDAPVSGGDVGARNGTLTIMVGGEQTAFDRTMPLFAAMGKNIRLCGPPGAGQGVKLCNQILCAVNMVAVCEAFELAEQMGINPSLVVEVCGTGAAGSWALSNLGPRILREDFAPGFMIQHMLKDLHLAAEAVGGELDELPGTALAEERFIEVQESDPSGGSLGTQAMMRTYKSLPV